MVHYKHFRGGFILARSEGPAYDLPQDLFCEWLRVYGGPSGQLGWPIGGEDIQVHRRYE
jgi:uncharacterized protein with LGFP repeats